MDCGGCDAALASGDPSEAGTVARPRTAQGAVRARGAWTPRASRSAGRSASGPPERGRLTSRPSARARPCRIAAGSLRWLVAGMLRSLDGSAHRRHGKIIMGYGEFARTAAGPVGATTCACTCSVCWACGLDPEPSTGEPL